MELLSVAEAREKILERLLPLGFEEAPLENALGRILFEDVEATIDLPPFPNSGMDGFAVRAVDVTGATADAPIDLPIVMDIPAGASPSHVLAPGQAARIMTGAMVPDGADSIVPIENTDRAGQGPVAPGSFVKVLVPAQPGEYVRPRGQDLKSGQVVLDRGRRLEPQDVGLLATLGISAVKVARLPRVAILSSGDEIVPVEEPLQPGKIHDSNSYMVAALVRQSGGEAHRLGVARDNLDSVRALLDKAASKSVDMIITTAGVSVGAFDFVRTAVEENGRLEFWRVNMRPGKPLTFGSYKGIPFVGLPGNPVSAYVGFEVFVRPALARMGGSPATNHPVTRVTLGEDVESDGRETYLRASLEEDQGGRLVAHLAGHQGSGNLFSLVQANALLILPSGVKSLPHGTEVDAWLLSNCLE